MTNPGEVIAERFRITAPLGQGGFGTTWLANDTRTDQLVALKELNLAHAEDWKSVELFEREAAILESLDHPQIPNYVDFIEADSGSGGYIVQTLAPGEPLSAMLDAGHSFAEESCREITRQVLGILEYLATRSPPVIHRDIKPSNLIMDDEGTVRLVDFGAVRQLAAHTVSGSTMVGTLGYMAPEQLQGEATIRSDIYGLGMTIVHLLTGIDPSELPKRRLKVDYHEFVSIAPAFEFVLDQMIQTIPEDRIASPARALTLLGEVDARLQEVPGPAPDGQLDALVRRKQQERSRLRAVRERAAVERRARLAKAREKLAKVTRIDRDGDGVLLVHDPTLLQRLTPGRVAGLLGGSAMLGATVLFYLLSTDLGVIIGFSALWLFIVAAAIAWIWHAIRAIVRERVFVRVNSSDNFMVYRRKGKPLGYGHKSELSISTWDPPDDSLHGGALIRAGDHDTILRRLSDRDVETIRKFVELTNVST